MQIAAQKAADAKTRVLEGTWQPVIPVLIEFPNRERAESWYASDAYGSIKSLRTAASECQAVLLESAPNDLVSD